MNTKSILSVLAVLSAMGLSSCKSGSNSYLPPCTGRPGEVLIVIADDLRKGAIGDTLMAILTQEEPALPQSGMDGAEPMFSIIHIPPTAVNNAIRSARNLVMIGVGDPILKPEIKVFKNYWADEQILIRIDAPDTDQLLALINDNRQYLLDILRNGEIDRQVAYNLKYQNHELNQKLLINHEIIIQFPKGFEARVDTGGFAWIQADPANISQGVLIWSDPYVSEDQLKLPELESFTNQYLKKRVPGPSAPEKNTFMSIVPDIKVITRTFTSNGRFVREMRGLWEVKGDYMGGPFISWTFVDEKRNRLVTAFGFVYAPKVGKRNPIRQVEGLLKTIDFPD